MGKIALIILLTLPAAVANAQDDQLVSKGNELYKKQQFDKAADEYRKAAGLNDKNPQAHYNLGNALYKNKKAEDAEKAYEVAADKSKDAPGKSRALYNKGVALTRQKKLEESINAYKQTLRLNPVDEEARQNLQKALNELKKQPPQPQPKDDKKQQDKKQDNKQPEPEKNNSKLNKKQVDQMLNALRQDEKKLQQELQKKSNTSGSNRKDW